MKYVTRAIIINDNKEVLVGKRARGKGAGLWAIIGGKIDPGETPEECVVREVEEELGVTFDPTLYAEEVDTGDPETEWYVYYFVGKITGNVTLAPDENTEVRYVGKKDLVVLSFAFGHEKILDEFFEKNISS